MKRRALRLGAELIPVLLILTSLVGAWGLVVLTYQRQAATRTASAPASRALAAPSDVVLSPALQSTSEPPVTAEVAIAPTPEDPTPKILAKLAALEAEQRSEGAKSDRKAWMRDRVRRQAEARAALFRSREMLVRRQAERLESQAGRFEDAVDALADLRDVLAVEKKKQQDELNLAAARARDGVAVLPYKGPNGTWRMPIAIECANGTATLRPGGPSIGLLELATSGARGLSPLALAVARRMARADGVPSPDGETVVPYILFVIRPDGIRPYYEARARLESLGIAFGYALVDQDTDIEYPDLDDPSNWPGGPPPRRAGGLAANGTPAGGGDGSRFVWPGSEAQRAQRTQSGGEFIWPTSPLGGRRTQMASADSDKGRPLGERAASGGTPASIPPIDLSRLSESPVRGLINKPDSRARMGSSPSGTGPSSPGSRDRTQDLIEVRPDGTVIAPAVRDAASAPPTWGNVTAGETGRSEPGVNPSSSASGVGAGSSLDRPQGFESLAGARGTGGSSDSSNHAGAHVNPAVGRAGIVVEGDRPIGVSDWHNGLNNPSSGLRPSSRNLGEVTGSPRAAEVLRRFAAAGITPQAGLLADGGSDGVPQTGTVSLGFGSGDEGQETQKGNGQGGSSGGSPLVDKRPEQPLEVVVACGMNEVMVHPGGYHLSVATLENNKSAIIEALEAAVLTRQTARPDIHWKPRVKFLVENGGEQTYWMARKQTILAGPTWPARLQVEEGGEILRLSRKDGS